MKAVKWVVLLLLMVLLIVFLFQNYEAFLSATTLEIRLPALPPLASKPIPLYGLILGSVFGGGINDCPLPWFGQLPFTQKDPFRSAAE